MDNVGVQCHCCNDIATFRDYFYAKDQDWVMIKKDSHPIDFLWICPDCIDLIQEEIRFHKL